MWYCWTCKRVIGDQVVEDHWERYHNVEWQPVTIKRELPSLHF
jgi:hypothetical protein